MYSTDETLSKIHMYALFNYSDLFYFTSIELFIKIQIIFLRTDVESFHYQNFSQALIETKKHQFKHNFFGKFSKISPVP